MSPTATDAVHVKKPMFTNTIVLDEHKLDATVAERFISATEGIIARSATGAGERVIRLEINCPGGKYAASFAMIDQVRRLQAAGFRVEAFISGTCGSLATVLAAACDRVVISANGQLMMHGLVITKFAGDYNAMRARLDRLEQQNAAVADILLARARRGTIRDPRFSRRRPLLELLRSADQVWLGPADALAAGLVDEIVAPETIAA